MGEISWDLYETRINIDGSTNRERNINRLKRSILDNIQDSPSYKTVTISNDNRNVIINDKQNLNKKDIVSLPEETFCVGEYVGYLNSNWLITAISDNDIYTKGEMSLCTLLLKWQNQSGETISRWAVVDKALPSLDGGNIIITSDKKMYIKLPFCLNSQSLFVNKRFLLEKANGVPLAYKLTSFDGISENYGELGGILNIELTQDEYNATTDNADLMIADYFSPTPSPTGQAQITGSSTIYVGGSWRYYSAMFLDEEGEVLPDVIPVWDLVLLPSQINKVTYEVTVDNRFRIKTVLDNLLIGTNIKILLNDSEGLYHAEQLVEVIDIG